MKMYHSTTQAGREGILRDGLKTGQSVTSFRRNDDGGYTKAGEWADEYYGTRPVYLAMQQGLYSQLARQLGLEFEVEVDQNTLVADLPSLVDTGAYITEDGMYWEYDDVPSAMKPVADGDGWIAFEELLQPGSIAAKAAINTTGTAASLNDIPQERVVQLTSESILREYIRELLVENPTLKHDGTSEYFRVDLGRIGYAQGGQQLRFKECQADVDALMQTPEYIAAKEKYEANNTTKDMAQDEDGNYFTKEVPAKFRPRFYDVANAWIHDEANRGKGHGKEIYRAFIDKAIEYSKNYGGVFIGAHHCTLGSGTSPDAKRLWKSLTKEYTSSGDVIFIGL